MTAIDPDDFVYIDSWEKLVAELGGRLFFCPTEHAPEVFARVRGTGKKTVLVTGHSDLGVVAQADAHPNADLPKMAVATNWGKAAAERGNYTAVQVGPCCDLDKCNEQDRLALKTERFTWATFDDIPEEIEHWYTTNLDVPHPRMELLPFGLNTDGHGSSLIKNLMGRPKSRLLYLNFQDNSLERIQLKGYYRGRDWLTMRDRADAPVGDYLAEVADHKFVLCPAGNGLDCYRLWECVYLGSYPVLLKSHFSMALLEAGLPVVVVDNLMGLTPEFLTQVEEALRGLPYKYDFASLSHWRDRLALER